MGGAACNARPNAHGPSLSPNHRSAPRALGEGRSDGEAKGTHERRKKCNLKLDSHTAS